MTVVYVSPPRWASLGQQYEVHSDRIVLRTLLGNVVIPFERFVSADVRSLLPW